MAQNGKIPTVSVIDTKKDFDDQRMEMGDGELTIEGDSTATGSDPVEKDVADQAKEVGLHASDYDETPIPLHTTEALEEENEGM